MPRPLPAPAPTPTPETQPYWDAAAEGRLVLPRCRACGTVIWYPRALCPGCQSVDVEWFEASGRGTVYSYTVNRTGRADHPSYRDVDVHVLAYVELAEGPRVLTNIVDVDPDGVRCGQPVQAVFHGTDGGSALVRFAPDAARPPTGEGPHPGEGTS